MTNTPTRLFAMNNTTYINKFHHTPAQFLHALLDVAEDPEKFESISFEHPSSNHPAVVVLAKDIVSDLHVIASAYKHGREITITRKPERVAKMPDAPVFWVRLKDYADPNRMRLVTSIATKRMYMGDEYLEVADSLQYEWSPDRKTWFNFYGEPVAVPPAGR